MTGKTHVAGGLLVGIIATQIMDVHIGYALISGLGALLPDIDEPHSTIGRKIPGSFLFKFLFGHRGFFHSLLAAGLFYLALFLVADHGSTIDGGRVHISFVVRCLNSFGSAILYPIKEILVGLNKDRRNKEYAFLFAMVVILLAIGGEAHYENYFIPLIALVLLVLFFQTPAVFAEEAMMKPLKSTVAPVSSEDFIQKISTMSYALYNVAVKVMAPLTVIILIMGDGGNIFKAARTIIVWAIIGLTLVFWSPMIVQLVMNWVTM